MIDGRIRDLLACAYEDRILVEDRTSFCRLVDYGRILREDGFDVVEYADVEAFRLLYEEDLKRTTRRVAVVVKGDLYIPYDIRQAFACVEISLGQLYPNLHAATLAEYTQDLDLIEYAYGSLYENLNTDRETVAFLEQRVFDAETVLEFISEEEGDLLLAAQKAVSAVDWIRVAQWNARIEHLAASIGLERSHEALDKAFKAFILAHYQSLSSVSSREVPSILTKTMDLIADGSKKVALVVMDGMSFFDFEILSRRLAAFECRVGASFALIPTVTSISRQSLLSGKYPMQLEKPFSLDREEMEFRRSAEARGYGAEQIFYGRGFETTPGPLTRCAAIIVNDIDDLVHGQRMGRLGMFNDMTLLAKSGKLQALLERLLAQGFRVWLTSDHGNTPCRGGGLLGRSGVEMETRSKRMVILKDFAEAGEKLKHRAFLYPGCYLDKRYQYWICNGNDSFDGEGACIMTHGGVSLDEVIVPFVEVRRLNNG